jgi:hypothetical protein
VQLLSLLLAMLGHRLAGRSEFGRCRRWAEGWRCLTIGRVGSLASARGPSPPRRGARGLPAGRLAVHRAEGAPQRQARAPPGPEPAWCLSAGPEAHPGPRRWWPYFALLASPLRWATGEVVSGRDGAGPFCSSVARGIARGERPATTVLPSPHTPGCSLHEQMGLS